MASIMPGGIEYAPVSVRITGRQGGPAGELERGQSGARPGTRELSVLSSLGQGEIISTRVVESLGSGRYLVLIKDTPLIADSQIFLASGSEVTVRVERPAPDVRLALINPLADSPPTIQPGHSGIINEYLKWQRSNPDGIRDLLAGLAERLDIAKTRNLPNSPGAPAGLSPESAAGLLSLVKRLQYGGGNSDNDWVRDYVRGLGLTTESDLLKCLLSGSESPGRLMRGADLKSALAEIAFLLQAGDETVSGMMKSGSKALSALVQSGIKSIEALQVANVALQDSQGPCAFQAPIIFADDRATAHLFIDGEREGSWGKKGAVRKFILLLDLDRLGAIRVEASLAQGSIGCLFRCESNKASDLVSGSLDSLRESLEAAGCRISGLGCIADAGVRRDNQVTLNERLGVRESLSLFA